MRLYLGPVIVALYRLCYFKITLNCLSIFLKRPHKAILVYESWIGLLINNVNVKCKYLIVRKNYFYKWGINRRNSLPNNAANFSGVINLQQFVSALGNYQHWINIAKLQACSSYLYFLLTYIPIKAYASTYTKFMLFVFTLLPYCVIKLILVWIFT